jgi:alpha-tubulin suppressor-like RCC1 family protein
MSRLRLLNVFLALFLVMLPAQPTQAAGNSLLESGLSSALLDDPAPTVTAISSGLYHTCELWSDGKISCWGAYTTDDQLVVPTPNENWVQVSAGHGYACARKNDDTLQCWGSNAYGKSTPTVTSDVMQITTGVAHTCAAQSDAVLYCWGFNDYGQTIVPPNTEWSQISAGYYHTCGIDLDGALQCWGQSNYGKTIVPTPNSGWTQVDGGGQHTCGIRSGTLYCWGAGTTIADPPDGYNYGQSIVPSGTFTQVSAGNLHTCGLKNDGTIQCWGYNGSGQTDVPEPNADWTQVSAGDRHTCGLKEDGTVRCWGVLWEAPVIHIDPPSLPPGAPGVPYSQSLTATDNPAPYSYPPYTFSIVSGSVPDGLTLNADGTWSGTTTTAGTFNFTVQAKDAVNIAGQQDYSLVIDGTPPTVVSITRTDPNPTVSTNVNFTVTFSENVTGVTTDDFVLVPSAGLVGGSILGISPGATQSVYYIPISTGAGTGTVRLDLDNDGSIKDLVSNPLGGGDFTGGQTYTIVKPFQSISTGSRDGYILETAETSSVGGSINASASTLRLGDDAAKKQYRSILSFTTGALPDTAVITRVQLKIFKQGIVGGGNPVTTFQGFMVDIKKGYFGTSSLQAADFQTAGSKTYGPFKPSLTGKMYLIDLTSGKAFINKLSSYSGLTQIRLRFKLDDNNNGTANYLSLYSGSGSPSYRPQLVIEYYVP